MKQQVANISSERSNLASLKFALDRLDVNYFETEDPQKIINSCLLYTSDAADE